MAKRASLANSLFKTGLRFKGRYLQIYLKKDSAVIKPLFCVAKNLFHNKPQRNRLRRLLKAAYQSQEQPRINSGHNFALMITANDASFGELKADLESLLKEIAQNQCGQ